MNDGPKDNAAVLAAARALGQRWRGEGRPCTPPESVRAAGPAAARAFRAGWYGSRTED